MVPDGNDGDRKTSSSIIGWSRRNVLKIGGAGVGLASLGGISAIGAGQEHDQEDENDENDENDAEDEDDDGDDSEDAAALLDDLVDPVFGYPLASDESHTVSLDTMVELVVEEGEGAHPDFPHDPEADGEVPAEFFFDPVGLQITPGTIVQFLIKNGEHTITAFHDKFSAGPEPIPTRVPDEVPGFTSPPLVGDESWIYEFTERGVYDLLCFPHLGLGMVMRVVVIDPEEDDVEEEPFSEPSGGAVPPNVDAVFTADELDPAYIVDAGPIKWEDLTIEVE